jgi:hypothetical protein
MGLRARLTFLAVASASGVACGPSFQVMYEGDSRFEHCYALDDNPNVLMQQKGDCWSDWLKHYTYGQTRDRVEFAGIRYRAISRAGALPTDEAIMGAAPGEGSGVSLAAPAPTNAFAPPPQTMVDYDGGGSAASPPSGVPLGQPGPASASPVVPGDVTKLPSKLTASDPPKPPGTSCVERCADTWQTCRGACASGGCPACDSAYTKCGRACLSLAPGS